MDFEPTETQELIRKTVRDYAETKILPRVMEHDESMEFPMELVKGLGELGLLGVIFPEKLDGAGFGTLEYATVVEELARVDPSIGLTVAAHVSLSTNHIFSSGTEEQKEKWVRPLASGDKIGA